MKAKGISRYVLINKHGISIGTVQTYFEVGKSPKEIIANIIEKFTLSREDAEKYVNECRLAVN